MSAESWTGNMRDAYEALELLTPKQAALVVLEHASDRLALMDILREWAREQEGGA